MSAAAPIARPTAALVRRALHQFSSPERAVGVARFFKTGEGQYGEGDIFIGCAVPRQRLVARQFTALPLVEADKLLTSKVHEERLTALLILVDQFNTSSDDAVRRKIFRLYRKRLLHINNWDLVDASAKHIVGGWLKQHAVSMPRTMIRYAIECFPAAERARWMSTGYVRDASAAARL